MDSDPDASSRSGSSASPGGAPSRASSNSYIRTSCDLCKRLKIKCEKQGESCLQCLNRGATCATTMVERKKRQPKRSTSLLEMENRIKRMESVIIAHGLGAQMSSEASPSPAASESPLTSPSNLTDRLSTLVINEQGKARFLGGSSGLSLFSPQGLEWVTQQTGSDALSQFIGDLATNLQTRSDRSAMELHRPPFASEREPLPPKHIADRYVNYFFEAYNSLFPLYDKATFDKKYELQYSGQPPSGLGWYASLNIVLCLGCLLLQVRPRGDPQAGSQNDVWTKYLRNASGCFLDLLFEEGNLEAIQALIGMSVVQQVRLEPQAVYILVAAAGRLAYGIGLHRNPNYEAMSEAEICQRKNVFWMVYTLDKSIALRLGHPSVMNDDDIGVDLPSEAPSDGTNTKAGLFRYHVQLARLESRIYSGLYSARGQNRPALERLRIVEELDKALMEWKEQLPVQIQPEKPIQCHEDLVLPIILLHFAYFNCLTIIHRVSVHHGSWTGAHQDQDRTLLQDEHHVNPRVYASNAICLSTARQSIQLLTLVDFENRAVEKSGLWMLLYHPLSNFLTLFANILQNPRNPQGLSDLKLMDLVITLLSEPAFHVNVPTAKAAQLFVELGKVARSFVEDNNSNGIKPTKRTRDAYDDVQATPQASPSGQGAPLSEPLAGSRTEGQESHLIAHMRKPIENGHNSMPLSLNGHTPQDMFQQQINNSPYLYYPPETIEGDLFSMSSTSFPADNFSFAPYTSEHFEWDLANLCGIGQSHVNFH